MQFINNIKEIREGAAKTQKECAEFLGVTQKGFAWYENANRLYFDVVYRLSQFFMVDISSIVSEKK